jgi:hypothetical protein
MQGWEMDETGSESCPIVDFCISSIEPLDSATGKLVSDYS